MHSELENQRRVLILTYRRYLEADRNWVTAARLARSWFPAGETPPRRTIGNPGSRLRRLYERRERALQQLQIVQRDFDDARHALKRRASSVAPVRPRLLAVVAG